MRVIGNGGIVPASLLCNVKALAMGPRQSIDAAGRSMTAYEAWGMVLTVLIVDDEPDLRNVLMDVLRDEGHRAFGAEDGGHALELVADRRPDVVLSDVAMPRLDGVALAAALARCIPPIPVVLMSAVHTGRVGQLPFLSKPFDLDVMLATIESVARRMVTSL